MQSGSTQIDLYNIINMRLYLTLSSTGDTLPFDHQPLLVGCIHKWLGRENSEHGKVALFSFSRIEGGKFSDYGLCFSQNAKFFISAYHPEVVIRLIKGILKDPKMFYGLKVDEIMIRQDPDMSDRERFFTASPILISRRINNKVEQILYDNPIASQYLEETVITKMKAANVTINSAFEIKFDTACQYATTKMLTYRGIHNRASWCPIIIKGEPIIKQFIWNVGLGNSTGVGFGAIE